MQPGSDYHFMTQHLIFWLGSAEAAVWIQLWWPSVIEKSLNTCSKSSAQFSYCTQCKDSVAAGRA